MSHSQYLMRLARFCTDSQHSMVHFYTTILTAIFISQLLLLESGQYNNAALLWLEFCLGLQVKEDSQFHAELTHHKSAKSTYL